MTLLIRERPRVRKGRCRVETASTCEFEDNPQGEIERDGVNATQNRWHSLPTRETRAAFSEAHGAALGFIYKFSTYLQCSYVSLTTITRATLENGEGSNACALPCGVEDVGQGESEVSAMRKIGIPSLAQLPALQRSIKRGGGEMRTRRPGKAPRSNLSMGHSSKSALDSENM